MFSWRYLRRSVVAILLLFIITLSFFAIYKSRSAIISETSSFRHSQHSYHLHKIHDHDYHTQYRNRLVTPDESYQEHRRSPNHNIEHKLASKHVNTITTTAPSSAPPTVNEERSSQNKAPSIPLIPAHSILLNNEQNIQMINGIQQNFSLQYQMSTSRVIETANLERIVHLDLKGAAPKVTYYEKLFPYLKQLGASGLLIEYEDMFPFTKNLSIVKHGFAYSAEDIRKILQLAAMNDLKVMPLLQVYGHLEYVLKLKEFMHLREDKRYPQVITPCLEESYNLLFEMIDQLLSLHPSIPYLHIGCDEVYYRLIHPQCVNLDFRDESDLFIRHVIRVAKYIKAKRPQIKLFIWHDMIAQLVNAGYNNTRELITLVVPMVWAYVDNINSWFDDFFWTKFATFPEVWVASSFKGSSGETTTISYIGHHQRNQQTWLEAMYLASQRFKVNFTGVAVTGWSRYDHMLSLCEFLPSSIPSLAYSLQTIVYGRLNDELNTTISRTLLGCNQMALWERPIFPTYVSCTFPGHELYEIMQQYDGVVRLYEETMSFVRLYVTEIHLRHNYIHFKRCEESLERLSYVESQMNYFVDVFQNASSIFFTADIGPEWLQTYFMRPLKDVQKYMNFLERALKSQSSWPQRPIPKNITKITVKRRTSTIRNVERVLK